MEFAGMFLLSLKGEESNPNSRVEHYLLCIHDPLIFLQIAVLDPAVEIPPYQGHGLCKKGCPPPRSALFITNYRQLYINH